LQSAAAPTGRRNNTIAVMPNLCIDEDSGILHSLNSPAPAIDLDAPVKKQFRVWSSLSDIKRSFIDDIRPDDIPEILREAVRYFNPAGVSLLSAIPEYPGIANICFVYIAPSIRRDKNDALWIAAMDFICTVTQQKMTVVSYENGSWYKFFPFDVLLDRTNNLVGHIFEGDIPEHIVENLSISRNIYTDLLMAVDLSKLYNITQISACR
jgi:hypothetical protein